MTDYQASTTSGAAGSGRRTLTAMFRDRAEAEAAIDRLVEEGFSRDDIRMVPGMERDAETTNLRSGSDSGGFWSSLADFFFPEEDRHGYAEGLSRGGVLVSVTTSQAQHQRALDILDDEGTIDMDDWEDSWRSQGWQGYSGADRPLGDSGRMGSTSGSFGTAAADASGTAGGLSGAGSTGAAGMAAGTAGLGVGAAPSDRGGYAGTSLAGADMQSDMDQPGVGSDMSGDLGRPRAGGRSADYGSAGGSTLDASRTGGAAREGEAIPIAEENLEVGKRQVEGGRVRVRSYVVETPVEKQVQLRRERVDIERRPVDRPIGAGDDPFRERTLEMEERREEPVIRKEARITEEVGLRKDVQDESRTVSDTVRKTEVEVDDQRAERSGKDEVRRRS
jgi:uncharacterized protein (TIGR02271 family)